MRPCACVAACRALGIVAGFRGMAALGTGAGGAGARGGFSARGAALWRGAWRVYSGVGGRVETRKPLIYNGFLAFRGAWRGAVFP